jgi:hypothetical protein
MSSRTSWRASAKEELRRLREVLDLGGLGRQQAAPCGSKLCRNAIGEEIVDHASRFY